MSEDFRALPPASIQGVLGSGIELTCTPPEGIPEPVVRWKKNGEFVDFASSSQRISITYNGHLRISSLIKSDEGKYQCAASNMAAIRDSRPVRLKVHGKKKIYAVLARVTSPLILILIIVNQFRESFGHHHA